RGRVRQTQLRAVRRCVRSAEAQLVWLAGNVVRRDAPDAIHPGHIGRRAAEQLVVAIQLNSPAFEHMLVRFLRATEVRVVPRLAVQDALAGDGAGLDSDAGTFR